MSHGAVIENVSNRKLCYMAGGLAAAQAAFFLIGALCSPVPSTYMEFELVMCEDRSKGASGEWFHIRPQRCSVIDDLLTFKPQGSFDLREIVFVAQMPHAREGRQLEYSPWFQFLLGLLQVDVEYHTAFKYEEGAKLKLDVRMGYRNHADEPDSWHEFLSTNVTRALDCMISPEKKVDGNLYDCGVMDLFELGSNSYPFYLLNIRIPIDVEACHEDPLTANCAIGKIHALRVIAIHQNGGFTRVWLALKSLLFPVVTVALVWYERRLAALPRKRLLLERAILALGTALAALDAPIEYLSLIFRMSFLLLISDIRQGLFYAVLFAFWLVFVGEHLIDSDARNNLASYWRNLSVIAIGCGALLIYDIAERGMQLADPFYSIWASETGTNIAYISIYVATACTILYFAFLFYKVCLVCATIRQKRAAQLYATCERRRLKVEAIIYRFKFLMLFTMVCCAVTIAAYYMRQYGEASLHGDAPEDSVMTHSSSAFFTGTFGMWNIYVLLLLAMYAPSHKQYSGAEALVDENDELLDGAGQRVEANPLTTFLKPAND